MSSPFTQGLRARCIFFALFAALFSTLAPQASAEYVFLGCPQWEISGFVDSSPGGVVTTVASSGVPAVCRPVAVSGCNFAAQTTVNMTCAWASPNQTDSQCVALGANNQMGANGTGLGAARAPDNVYHCAIVVSPTYLDDQKTGGPCKGCFGNPINVASANKFQIENDYVDPQGLLSFTRIYNSKGGAIHANIGAGWHHNFAMSISNLYSAQAAVRRPDSKLFVFRLSGGQWAPDADVDVKLETITGGWKITNDDSSVELFDSAGRLTTLTNAQGQSVAFTYSDGTANPATGGVIEGTSTPLLPGHLTRATDFRGRTLEFRYNASHKIVKLIDPLGQTYQYAYGTNNNIATVTYPGSLVRTYHFNESAYTSGSNLPNALTGITDEKGVRYARFKYDISGRATGTEYVVPTGAVQQYTVSYSGSTATVVTPLGASLTIPHAVAHSVPRRTSQTKPCPGCGTSTETFTRDTRGNVTAHKDFNGHLACFTFDATRNVETSRVEGLSGTGTCASKVTTSATRTITTEWHTSWRLPKRIAEPLKITTLAYHGDSGVSCAPAGASTSLLCSKSVQATTDANGSAAFSATATGSPRVSNYTYNLAGQILSIDGPRTDVTDVASFTYYASDDPSGTWRAGDLATTVNAKGQTTQFVQYDAAGRLKKSIDPNGLETILAYSPRGWLTSRQVGTTALGFEATTFEQDNTGQLTKVTLPDASFVGYRYDNAHRLYEIYDGLGNRITYTLDNAGNRTAEETFDPASVLTRKLTRNFDVLGRLWKSIGGTDPTNQVITNAFDPNGNVTSITDPLTRVTNQEFDALNRLAKVKDPFNGVSAPTQYGYNGLDGLTSVTDPKGLATTYTVNGLGDQTALVSPDTGTTAMGHDAAGNVTSRQDARGVSSTISYDELNRVTQITYPDETVLYAYDSCTNGIGRLCSITDRTGVTSFAFDKWGRVTGKTQSVASLAQTNSYAFNSAGQLTSVTTPSGQSIEYGYSNNRPVSVKVNGTDVLTSAYWEPFGPNGGWVWGNSTGGAPNTHTRIFDLDYRLARVTSDLPLGGGNPALDRQIGWDRQSRVATITDIANAALSGTYGYDALDRITSAGQGTNSWGFSYDGVGNRLTQSVNAASTTYTYPGSSHRLSSLSGAQSKSFTHDLAGNQTADGTATWTFGGANRPTQVVVGAATTTFDINALGQRVRKGTQRFVFDEQGRLQGEYLGDGTLIQETVWLEDLPIATLRPKAGGGVDIFYVHPDHLGTPRAVTRSTDNQLVWRWDNTEPFGNSAPDENPSGLGAFSYNLRFPGQYFDVETGTHYNYFRDYDPRTGRYIESDPLGLVDSLGTYTYVSSSPLAGVDPYGLWGAFGQIGLGGGFHAGPGGLNGTCGGIVSLGNASQRCTYCTVCVRLGPGLFLGGGASAGGGLHGGSASNNLSGWSYGVGFDAGAGLSVGGSGGLGFSGSPGPGSWGSLGSAGGMRGRGGKGFGVSLGLEACKTEIKCTPLCP